MSEPIIRPARSDDWRGAYEVCLRTGDFGRDGTPLFAEDPEALGRLFVGPYLSYELSRALVVELEGALVGYAFGALDSKQFYDRYEREWRPSLCARYPDPCGPIETWSRVQHVHHWYHHPDYFCPPPYTQFPSHLHIDLLPVVQGRGLGRAMLERVMARLHDEGSPGAHLGVSLRNESAMGFYRRLGFVELARNGEGLEACVYLGKRLACG